MSRLSRLLPVILILPAVSLANEPRQKTDNDTPDRRPGWTVGVGAVYITRPYRAIDDRFIPLPFATYRGPRLAVLGPRVNFRLFTRGILSLSATASVRFAGYDPDDSPFLAGMSPRRDTLEAGGIADVKLPWQSELQVEWRADTLGRHNGNELGVSFRRAFQFGRLRLAPSVEWTYLSSNLTSTYFGVRPTEVRANRPAYDPGSCGTTSAGLSMFFRTRERVSLFAGFRATRLPSALTESPIVSERTETRTMVGVMWNLKSLGEES